MLKLTISCALFIIAVICLMASMVIGVVFQDTELLKTLCIIVIASLLVIICSAIALGSEYEKLQEQGLIDSDEKQKKGKKHGDK